MKEAELCRGTRVRIIDFEDEDDRPGHWNDYGEMDDWRSCVVTINDSYKGFHKMEYHIVEDEGRWMWLSSDFSEVVEEGDPTNPNFIFRTRIK